MKLQTTPEVALIDYIVAPWHLRLRWLLEGWLWRLCGLFVYEEDVAPEQQSPLWHR